jgi:hypothetical protein
MLKDNFKLSDVPQKTFSIWIEEYFQVFEGFSENFFIPSIGTIFIMSSWTYI